MCFPLVQVRQISSCSFSQRKYFHRVLTNKEETWQAPRASMDEDSGIQDPRSNPSQGCQRRAQMLLRCTYQRRMTSNSLSSGQSLSKAQSCFIPERIEHCLQKIQVGSIHLSGKSSSKASKQITSINSRIFQISELMVLCPLCPTQCPPYYPVGPETTNCNNKFLSMTPARQNTCCSSDSPWGGGQKGVCL